MPHVKLRLINTSDHLLSSFDRKIAEYTTQHFRREGGWVGGLMGPVHGRK